MTEQELKAFKQAHEEWEARSTYCGVHGDTQVEEWDEDVLFLACGCVRHIV